MKSSPQGQDRLTSGKRTEFSWGIKQDGPWWIGWVEEIPGVNGQGRTRAELQKNLRSALKKALAFSRDDALAAAPEG